MKYSQETIEQVRSLANRPDTCAMGRPLVEREAAEVYLRTGIRIRLRQGRDEQPSKYNYRTGKYRSGTEKRFDEGTPPAVEYVGGYTGRVWIDLPNGKRKNPDFLAGGPEKVIEIMGDAIHMAKRTDAQVLIELYWRAGVECLVIWASWIYDDEQWVYELVRQFIMP